jgi:hypothetical protein
LAILRGEDPWSARPIIASADPQVVRIAFSALLELIAEPEGDLKVVRRTRPPKSAEDGGPTGGNG